MTTHSARRVGDLAKTDEKTTPTPGRQPATKKTIRTEEDDCGTPECVPKVVKGSFKNICDNLDKKDVISENEPKNNFESHNLTLRLPLQPFEPTQEQL